MPTRAPSASRPSSLNKQIINVHRTRLYDYSRDLLEYPGLELIHGEGRSALLHEAGQLDQTGGFDLIQMSAIDTWTALQSGAYMLAENYLYTQDSIDDMFAVLTDSGAVQVTRFSGDVEALRLLATLRAAHERAGSGRFADCVVCVPSRTFMSIPGEACALHRRGAWPAGYLLVGRWVRHRLSPALRGWWAYRSLRPVQRTPRRFDRRGCRQSGARE